MRNNIWLTLLAIVALSDGVANSLFASGPESTARADRVKTEKRPIPSDFSSSSQDGGSPNFFTEQFFGDNDLDFKSILFTPTESSDFYHACARTIDSLPTDPSGGAYFVALGDDDYAQISLTLGATVSLYGVSYSEFYIGTNGYITFGSGDTDDSESLAEHFDRPRISGLFDALHLSYSDPPTLGIIMIKQLSDRMAVTWLGIPESGTLNFNTFQIEMFFNADIQISYLTIDATDGLTGLSEGKGLSAKFVESNLSAALRCDCNGNGVLDMDDIDAGTSKDLNGNGIPDECDDCNQNGVDDSQDIADGSSTDCNDNAIPDECEDSDTDCNDNGTWDGCDIANGTSLDCNGNTVPDECDVADGTNDCNGNAVPDGCDLAFSASNDCTQNGIPDECDIADGTAIDCDDTGIPDVCEWCSGQDPCDAANVALVPVGANGSYTITITGNEIIVAPGTRVFLDVRVARWDPYLDGRTLRRYWVTIDSGGYSNAFGGALTPAVVPCASDSDCEAAFGRGATCNDPPGAGVRCTSAFIDTQRDDFATPGFLAYVYTPTPESVDYTFTVKSIGSADATDPGVDQYAGTLVLDLPKDAQGTFEIGFIGGHYDTFLWRWGDGDCFMPVTNRTPALITVGEPCSPPPGTFADCNENGIPDGCDITDGTSRDCNGNGVPDGCETTLAEPPQAPDGSQAYSKNRYLSFVPPDSSMETALLVTLVESEQFPAAVGSTWWVGEPAEYCQNGGLLTPPLCAPIPGVLSSTFLSSSLQCNQECMDWGSVGETIHVGDSNIVPGASYEIRAIPCGCDAADPSHYSDPLPVATSKWGDTVSNCQDCSCGPPDGTVNIIDCREVLQRFVNSTCAPSKSRVDLDPAEPDRQINVTDALACIQAFQGLPYDLPMPVGCE